MRDSKDYRHGKASTRRDPSKSSAKRGCLVERIAGREATIEMRWAR
jgi:hypothetical protein